MVFKTPDKINPSLLFVIALTAFLFSGCTVVRKYQKNKPFVFENKINLNIDDVTSDEKVIIRSRLNTQLDDSSKVRVKDVAFILHYIDRPPAFDTIVARASADNMQISMVNLGYYSAKADFEYSIDSTKKDQKRVTTTYEVDAGKRTLIDTFAYLLDEPELQQLALQTKNESPLQKNAPVTKAAISRETARLVDLYRNNGYYKFTSEELRVTGDTTIEALTTVSDDPFETLRLLAEATEKRNKPTIRLGILLNKLTDSTRLNKFYIRNIYILPDYVPGDNYSDTILNETITDGYIIRYHNKLFSNNLLVKNMYIKSGSVYRQEDYFKTINSLYKLGGWESPAIDIIESDDNELDLIVKLAPVKKYGFEGDIELSYSANSNTSNSISAANSGNLLGISANISLLNRNVGKEAIRMTNAVRAGVEFNTGQRTSGGSIINSNEISYSNSILFPKFITPFRNINRKKLLVQQSFINTNVSLIKRINFFNQQVFNISHGYNWTNKASHSWIYTPLNFDFRRIYNTTERFDKTLDTFPFLRYSFNTALVMGQSLRFASNYINPDHPKRSTTFKFNLEESGLIWGILRDAVSKNGRSNFLTNYLKQFIKTDVEYTYTISHPKSAVVFRLFGGVGIPLSKLDTALPFFKQYFGGGPNSMRGWPVRGIGIGSQPLTPFDNNIFFNDRTGDIQLEANAEYRYNIAPLFSNSVFLKGAFFIDAGNIWNFKNTKANGALDSTQFKFKNIYKQLGVSAGTGLRLDFSYFLVRFDMGFRFKRPDITMNDGWQFPDINLKNLFGNDRANRRWRYENFNFTIGIDYPF